MKKRLLVIVTAMFVAVFPMFGQRTAPGSGFISADFVDTFESFGAQLTYGYYFQHFYVVGGVNAAMRTDMRPMVSELSETEYTYNMYYSQITAIADWMYRFYGSRSRVFTLNGGGGILLGAEIYDPFNRRPTGGQIPDKDASFLYGFDVRLDMEIFIFRKTALVIGGRLPITFGTACTIFNYELSAGFRFNL